MGIIFCHNCGNKLNESDQFCNNCGARTQGIPDDIGTHTVSIAHVNRPLLIGIIVGLAVILAGVYIYMAWLPPTLAKSMNAMKKQQSYEQRITISVPYEDEITLNFKKDNRQELAWFGSTIEGEKVEGFLEKNRLIIGSPEYKMYGAVRWNESGDNDKRTRAYLKSLQQELKPIGKVVTKQILKPNSDIKFSHALVSTPGGDIKVKQYNLKMKGEQLAQAIIDTSGRLNSDQAFRGHIKSAYNKTIDYVEDVAGSSMDRYTCKELRESRDSFDDGITELIELLDEADEQSELKEELADCNLELQMGFDYHNRLVELILTARSPDGNIKIKNTCYNFNKPVDIALPSSNHIHEVGSLEDLSLPGF